MSNFIASLSPTCTADPGAVLAQESMLSESIAEGEDNGGGEVGLELSVVGVTSPDQELNWNKNYSYNLLKGP